MKVVITSVAKNQHLENVNYLIKEWDLEVLKKYLDKYDKVIHLLENKLIEARYDEDLKLYKILITKHIYLFYEIDEVHEIIYIIYTWNNAKKSFWL